MLPYLRYGNAFKALACKSIASALATNTTLTVLNIGGNKLGVGGARPPDCSFLGAHAGFFVFSLFVPGSGAKHLASAFSGRNCTLRVLKAAECGFGDPGGKALFDAIVKSSVIADVDVRSNSFKAEAAAAVARMLDGNKSVRRLNLKHNQVILASQKKTCARTNS